MLGFQGGVSIPLVKGGVKAPPAKRQCRAGPKAGARRGFTFQSYDTQYGATHLRPSCPALVSSSRFGQRLPRALVPLGGYLPTRKGRGPGITFGDSPPLAVCHNRRIARHTVCDGDAPRGKSSLGWFLGCKLPLMVNDEGELGAFR